MKQSSCGKYGELKIKKGMMFFLPYYCNKVLGEKPCPSCAERRCVEVLSDIKSMGDKLFYKITTPKEAKSMMRAGKKSGDVYQKIPIPDGTVAFITTAERPTRNTTCQKAPDNLDSMVKSWLKNQPEETRISSTHKHPIEKEPQEVESSISISKLDYEKVREFMSKMGSQEWVSSGGFMCHKFSESDTTMVVTAIKALTK